MIFSEIVVEVAERLNLTSDEAKSRIARNLNNRYRRVTSSIGLDTSRFVQVSQIATIGNRTITFQGVEKLIAVIDKSTGVDVPLSQVSMDEMHIIVVKTDPPRKFAVTRIHPSSVDIYVDSVPSTAYTLYADAHTNVINLGANDQPDFPESFHDILIFGGMADEYRKMEKAQLADMSEKDYEARLSDLRMWIAKSAYRDIYQGKYQGKNFRWTLDPQTSWD